MKNIKDYYILLEWHIYTLYLQMEKMKFEEVGKYIDSIWWTCGDVIKTEED